MPYIHQLRAYLQEQGFPPDASLTELLADFYVHRYPVDAVQVDAALRGLGTMVLTLSHKRFCRLRSCVTILCEQYQRRSFSAGLHVGIWLAAEIASISKLQEI